MRRKKLPSLVLLPQPQVCLVWLRRSRSGSGSGRSVPLGPRTVAGGRRGRVLGPSVPEGASRLFLPHPESVGVMGSSGELARLVRVAKTARELRWRLSLAARPGLAAEEAACLVRECPDADSAREVYRWARQQAGFCPDPGFFAAALTTRGRAGEALGDGERIAADMREVGVRPDKLPCEAMMRAAAAAGKVELVETWFRRAATATADGKLDVDLFNALLAAYNRLRLYERTLSAFQFMRARGVTPNPGTLGHAARALAATGRAADALRIFADGGNSSGLAATCSGLADALANDGRTDEATFLLLRTQRALGPSAYPITIPAFARLHKHADALALLRLALSHHRLRDPSVFASLIKMYSNSNSLPQAHAILCLMVQTGFATYEPAFALVIKACVRAHRLLDAVRLFREMGANGCAVGQTTYTSMLNVFAQLGNIKAANELFAEMLRRGFGRNKFAYSIMINMYRKRGMPEEAVRIYDFMKKAGCQPDSWIYAALIDMHGRSGESEAVYKLFEEMLGRGIVPSAATFGTLVMMLCRARRCEKAIEVLGKCKTAGIKLDYALFEDMVGAYKRV